jgi:molybdate transport system ATP-binding protein
MELNYSPPTDDTIVSFQGATLRLRDRLILPDMHWTVKRHQHWVVMGPNGAGKTTLVKALAGKVPVVRGKVWPPDIGADRYRIAYVSFDQHRQILAREDRLDAARWYSGRIDKQTTVLDYLSAGQPPAGSDATVVETLVRLRGEGLLDRGVRHLSSGEMRKVLIAHALLRKPEILILDEPYNGLDAEGSRLIHTLIDRLISGSRPVILVTHRRHEIPSGATHLLGVKDGRIVFQGAKEDILGSGRLETLYASEDHPDLRLPPRATPPGFSNPVCGQGETLVEIRDAVVKYRKKPVINKLSWTIKAGENWALLGPNGSGKTTLLNLLYGDHPQVYANHVQLFGRRRGSGESIWEIKARIGMVSTELQIRYRKPVTALEAVISGFYDAIGLYRRPARHQMDAARDWLQVVGAAQLAPRRFDRLSTGEQRLVLIARAMVKSPGLLLLDEPTQGLDPRHRQRVLEAVDAVGMDPAISVVFVGHRAEDLPGSITHILTLVPSAAGSSARIQTLRV